MRCRPTELALLHAATLLANPGTAQDIEVYAQGPNPGTLRRETLADAAFQESEVYLFAPRHDPERRYPLVVFLHGNNQPPQRFLQIGRTISTADAPVFILAPRYQREVGKRMETVDRPLDLNDAALAHALDHYPIDPQRIVLLGFSRGTGYARQWQDRRVAADLAPRFCEVWSCGGASCPARVTPDVPHLLFVGEKENAVQGRLDIRQAVRTTFVEMVERGFDVTYLEAPGMEHRVGTDCIRVMRERLQTLAPPPHAANANEFESLPTVSTAVSRGEFGAAFRALDAILAGSEARPKAAARRHQRTLRKAVDELAEKLEQSGTLAAYDRLTQLTAQLADHPRAARRPARALAALTKSATVQRERRAQTAYRRALELAADEIEAALVTLAEDAELRDTDYGQRAQSHLQALGRSYTSPQFLTPSEKDAPR